MSKFSLLSKANFNNVDIVKVCMAVMVVALHTVVYCSYANDFFNRVGKALVDLAVPFFFIASGFFLGEKLRMLLLTKKWIVLQNGVNTPLSCITYGRWCIFLTQFMVSFETISVCLAP